MNCVRILSLARMLAGANAFEISDIQEDESEAALARRSDVTNVALGREWLDGVFAKHRMISFELFAQVEPPTSQQTTPTVKNGGASTNQKDSVGKTVQDLTEQIKDLKSRIRLLEAQQDELRGRITPVERPQSSPDLNDAASGLAQFD